MATSYISMSPVDLTPNTNYKCSEIKSAITQKTNKEYFYAIIECKVDDTIFKRKLFLPWNYVPKLYPEFGNPVYISITGVDRLKRFGQKEEIRKAFGFDITKDEKKF